MLHVLGPAGERLLENVPPPRDATCFVLSRQPRSWPGKKNKIKEGTMAWSTHILLQLSLGLVPPAKPRGELKALPG